MTAPYSRLDRALHYAAFSAVPAQLALADIERMLFGREFNDIQISKPVFITAMPRAGTTLLLSVLAKVSDFSTHTYRDMPFVLTPLLWTRISEPFRKSAIARERAHGDGMTIDYDSPEAFEEIVWKAHWPKHYHQDRIIPWSSTEDESEFANFLRDHMRKIISLHASSEDGSTRYLSKNNANIARLNILARAFPDCRILIPVRHPWHHAESLRRQHKRFTDMHAEDLFSRRYMEWLGHYEFGAALRPIDFEDWMESADNLDPTTSEFWLTYWYRAYTAVQKAMLGSANAETIILVDYDRLCDSPGNLLPKLAEALELRDPTQLLDCADQFRPSRTYEIDEATAVSPLYQACEELYESLCAQSLIHR